MQFFRDQFGKFARLVNALASSPGATAVAFAIVILWVAAGPRFHYSEFWQLIMNTTSSIITFLMVFVLNNAQSRDTAAINAKLDTLILALEHADNRLVGLDVVDWHTSGKVVMMTILGRPTGGRRRCWPNSARRSRTRTPSRRHPHQARRRRLRRKDSARIQDAPAIARAMNALDHSAGL